MKSKIPFFNLKVRSQVFLLIATFSLAACSNNQPQIDQSVGSVILHFDSVAQSFQESFSVFSAVQDKDGFQDIDSMYIMDDFSQLLWHLAGPDLQNIDNGSRHWIGNRRLIMPHGEAMPVGKLRIIMYDRAGNKALSELGLPLMDANLQALIPKAKRNGSMLEINPGANWEKMDREIIVQDWSGAELGRYRSSGSSVKIDSLLNGRKDGDVKFVIYDNLYDGSLLISSGPW